MSMIRRNADLLSRLGDPMSKKTGIPRQDIIVRHPSKTHGKPVIPFAKESTTCDLCGKEIKHLEPVKIVIVQDKNHPTQTTEAFIVCLRSDRCVTRYNKGQEEG